MDRHWNLIQANDAMEAMIAEFGEIDPALLEPPVNILRAGLHPDGLAPALANLGRWKDHFVGRLDARWR